MSLKTFFTTGSTSNLFITASTIGISSLIICSADETMPILVRMFLSTISAIWSRFIIFILFIEETLSSTVLGFDKSMIIMPVFFEVIASFILSYVTRKYGATVATNNTSTSLNLEIAFSNLIGFPPTVSAKDCALSYVLLVTKNSMFLFLRDFATRLAASPVP